MLRQRLSKEAWDNFYTELSQIKKNPGDLLPVDGVVYYGAGLWAAGSGALSSTFSSQNASQEHAPIDIDWLAPAGGEEPIGGDEFGVEESQKERPQLRIRYVEEPEPHMLVDCSDPEAAMLDMWRLFIVLAKRCGLQV